MNVDEKECPFCAEVIKKKAIKCRFCGADLTEKLEDTKKTKNCPLCAEDFDSSLSECPHCSKKNVRKDNQIKPSLNAESINKAGFWRRGAALLIDSLIFITPLNLYFYLKSGGPLQNQIELILNPFYWLFSFLFAFLYYTVLNYKYGGTVGKLALGIKIKNENYEDITYPQSIGRFFAIYLSSVILGIGYLIQPFTQKKQALHDLLARTVVIDEKRITGWVILLIYVILIAWSIMWTVLMKNKSISEDDIAVIEKQLNEDNAETESNKITDSKKEEDLNNELEEINTNSSEINIPKDWELQYTNGICLVYTGAMHTSGSTFIIKMGYITRIKPLQFHFSVKHDSYKEANIYEETEAIFRVDDKYFDSISINNENGEIIIAIKNSKILQRSLKNAKVVGIQLKNPPMDSFEEIALFSLNEIGIATSWLNSCVDLGQNALPK